MLDSSSVGSELEPGTVPGHGWEEHGSPQVILSSNKGQIYMALLMLVI